MDYRIIAQQWLERIGSGELHDELVSLLEEGNEGQLEDAFFQELSFGTAGLRGVIGVGTNRMNLYTVGRATQGLASYIVNTVADESARSVCIARDSRHKGEEFVSHAASVLAANGIRVHVYPRIEPTPALSFAVRDFGASAGICMTASHNPAAYNGYKVYGSDGCQITSEAAKQISACIASIDPFEDVKHMDFDEAVAAGLVTWIEDDVLDRFIDAVLACRLDDTKPPADDVRIVYTPLCGTGLECMNRVFEAAGYSDVEIVPSQKEPDGDFPTCTYPNPEERAALEEGIALCRQTNADLLLATDPDADRVGIAVKHNGDYVLMTGNEVGVMLLNYLCDLRKEQGKLNEDSLAVSTIVSTDMIDGIADAYDIRVMRTLTGFKYIGDIVTDLSTHGEEDNFVLGFEESYGYLSGTHVRDKDAINASVLICDLARHCKALGTDLVDYLGSLYETYGFFANRTINIAFPGADGSAQMKELMARLRNDSLEELAGRTVSETRDYAQGRDGLPPADVVSFILDDGCKILFRPSGTEPKLKAYLFAKSTSMNQAHTALDELEEAARALV